jgi:hypothetical protein
MADLNEFLAQVTARGQIPGLSLATLRVQAREALNLISDFAVRTTSL